MTFCPNCGTQLPEGTVACPNCGTFVNGQPQQPQQPQYNPYNNVPMGYVTPKLPGRGLGIAGMVLSIIGLVYGFILMVNSIAIADSTFSRLSEEFIPTIIVFSVLSILGVSLAGAGRGKGYRTGISMSGVVMGVIGLAMYLISLIVLAAD